MNIAVSACLLGTNCKYNGKNNKDEQLLEVLKGHTIIPICPEVAGGLGTPRIPCEINHGKVINRNHEDKTKEFQNGADITLKQLQRQLIDYIVLQPRSPSCGVHQVYDGSFQGKLITGQGVFARIANEKGYQIMEPDEFKLLSAI